MARRDWVKGEGKECWGGAAYLVEGIPGLFTNPRPDSFTVQASLLRHSTAQSWDESVPSIGRKPLEHPRQQKACFHISQPQEHVPQYILLSFFSASVHGFWCLFFLGHDVILIFLKEIFCCCAVLLQIKVRRENAFFIVGEQFGTID